MWRTATFSYLDGWVQVTSDHVANHYSLLATAYAVEKASTPIHTMVSSVSPPTECSLSIMPSAQLSHKGGTTTCPKGSLQNIMVNPGSSDPPAAWKSWEEYLEKRPGEITPYQVMAVLTHNQLKIGRSVVRTLELFDWYVTSRLAAVIGCFNKRVGADSTGERWRHALVNFAYKNICFDMKQLVEVLRGDLQVMIQHGLTEVQEDILEAVKTFIDSFHIKVSTLSPPQVNTLLNYLCAYHVGSHSFLSTVKRSSTYTQGVFPWERPKPYAADIL